MTIEAGQVLNERYRLIRPLGQGSQASVWVAEHLALSTQVAVKLIDPELAKKDDALERFRREATAAAHLRSAHVVQILDHGIEGNQPFIVMELLEGEDLFERLERRRRLSLQETSRIVTHVSRALGRAHAAGIVHRDLKPENFFLISNEDEEIVKVLDFGVAKVSDPAKQTMKRTGVGTLIGTPHYMSPEQVKGIGEVDHRTDLWALGVIAYQCVTGDLPFDSEGVGDLLIKIATGEAPVPSKAMPELPPAFDAWFARACAHDAARRFASARDLAESLARVAGLSTDTPSVVGEPTAPKPPAALPRPTSRGSIPPSEKGKPGRGAAPSLPSIQTNDREPRSAPRAPLRSSPDADRTSAPPSVPRPPVSVRRPASAAPSAPEAAAAKTEPAPAKNEPAAAAAPATKARGVMHSIDPDDIVEDHGEELHEVEEHVEAKAAPPRSVPPRAAFESHEVHFESEVPPSMRQPAPSRPTPTRPATPVPVPAPAPAPSAPQAQPTPRALPVRAPTEAPRIVEGAHALPLSTVSGLASVSTPPELDGSERRRKLTRYFVFALLALTGGVVWTVVRSQIPPKEPEGATAPPASTEPASAQGSPLSPLDLAPRSSASAAQAVDPGRLSSGVAPLPPPPKATAPTGRPRPKKDDMTIEIPLPAEDVPPAP